MKSFVLAATMAIPLVANAQSGYIQLEDLFPDSEVSGTLEIVSIEPTGDRCEISVVIDAPALFSELDDLGRSKGNMGSSRNRLYWVGPTSLRRAVPPGTILLTSRARYESHTYVFGGNFKNFQDTKTIDLRLSTDWNGNSNTLSLTYQIQNIRNFPGAVESALRNLGVNFGGSSALAVPQTRTISQLNPKITEGPVLAATEDGKGLSISAIVTADLPSNAFVDSCTALKSVLAADPDRLSDFALSVIDGMD